MKIMKKQAGLQMNPSFHYEGLDQFLTIGILVVQGKVVVLVEYLQLESNFRENLSLLN